MVKCKTVEEIGFVRSVEGINATVSVPKKSGCEGCSLKTCRPEEQFMLIEALNPLEARVGQKVRVTIKPYTYLKGSMVVYGLPALGLVAGAVAGKEFVSPYLGAYDPDMVSAVFGFGAFAVSFFLVRLWTARLSGKAESRPVVEEILDETG